MLRNFFAREELAHQAEGQTLVEYGLLLALIAVVCIAAVTLFGTRVDALFDSVGPAI